MTYQFLGLFGFHMDVQRFIVFFDQEYVEVGLVWGNVMIQEVCVWECNIVFTLFAQLGCILDNYPNYGLNKVNIGGCKHGETRSPTREITLLVEGCTQMVEKDNKVDVGESNSDEKLEKKVMQCEK